MGRGEDFGKEGGRAAQAKSLPPPPPNGGAAGQCLQRCWLGGGGGRQTCTPARTAGAAACRPALRWGGSQAAVWVSQSMAVAQAWAGELREQPPQGAHPAPTPAPRPGGLEGPAQSPPTTAELGTAAMMASGITSAERRDWGH